VGAVHRRQGPRLLTVAAAGPGTARRLGRELCAEDPALAFARRGEAMMADPNAFDAAVAVAERLGALPACAGVAVIPVVIAGRLYALAELGRPDHAFRRTDCTEARRIVRGMTARLEIVRNPRQR
jgi:hypothetical protein